MSRALGLSNPDDVGTSIFDQRTTYYVVHILLKCLLEVCRTENETSWADGVYTPHPSVSNLER